MTKELPVFSHNLGNVLNELVKESDLLLADINSLVDVYESDWSSQPLRRMFDLPPI